MKYIIWLLAFLLSSGVSAQVSKSLRQNRKDSKNAVLKISNSLQQNVATDTLAWQYREAALQFVKDGDYDMAYDFYQRSGRYYQSSGEKEEQAFVERELGKIAEWQYRMPLAITHFEEAEKLSADPSFKTLNRNDINRLKSQSDPGQTIPFIQSNIDLSSMKGQKLERGQALRQMAQANMQLDNKQEALQNLEAALDDVRDIPSQSLGVEREIADVLVKDSQIDKAIEVNQSILEKARENRNTLVQIEQLKTLSSNYMTAHDKENALRSLEDAYLLAVEKGHTLEAGESVGLLAEQYRKENKPQKAFELYADFLSNLGNLVASDSSLIDRDFFKLQEERITQLESERMLKDELIYKQERFNNILIVAVLLIFLSLLAIGKTLYSIKKKNKKIALQSLRREMNPHFIFNSLNSVNQFIAGHNELEANKYLTSYSRLMRNMMENSSKDFTSLATELEQLKEYLELEHMRFKNKFRYEIQVDDELDTDAVSVPNMLIQPQIENAVWHGLRYKECDGLLLVSFRQEGGGMIVTVDDNGIGIRKSQELKTGHQKSRQSRGQKNTRERIELLNSLYNGRIRMDIEEKSGDETGVVVTFRFPLKKYTK